MVKLPSRTLLYWFHHPCLYPYSILKFLKLNNIVYPKLMLVSDVGDKKSVIKIRALSTLRTVYASKIFSWKFVMASEMSFEFRIASLARKSFNRLPILHLRSKICPRERPKFWNPKFCIPKKCIPKIALLKKWTQIRGAIWEFGLLILFFFSGTHWFSRCAH